SLFGLDGCRVLWLSHNTPPTAPEERRRARVAGLGLRPPETTPVKARGAYASLFGLDGCRVLWLSHNTPPTAPEERRRARFAGPLRPVHALLMGLH
ncbi:MAG TPA: hypothetical protein VKI99_18835, partial [Candidatus Dormibacteraeota bacterium]|nr:hypothetical protein [Candidatus Dormibacteraeota bacterium]